MEQQTFKEIALDFLALCSKGNSKEAFGKYAGPKFRHHNVYFRGDADTLMKAMEENARQMPEKTFEVKHALQDGDMVAVHSHMCPRPDNRGVAIVHLFRFESGKIAELWDLGQPVPEQTVNENGMF